MKTSTRLLALLAGLGAAAPAAAQYRQYPGASHAIPSNAVRLEIGGATLSSPGICTDRAAFSGGCVDSSPFAWQALSLSGDLDLALGGPVSLTLGAHELFAPYYSGNPNLFEPSLGVAFNFSPRGAVQPRLSAAGALLLGNDGNTGGALRLGGGLSFFGRAPIGLALDLLVDIGAFGGYEITQISLAVGPEFRF
jgi:hypothetical protein